MKNYVILLLVSLLSITLIMGIYSCKREVVEYIKNPLLQPIPPDTSIAWNQWGDELFVGFGKVESMDIAHDSSIWILASEHGGFIIYKTSNKGTNWANTFFHFSSGPFPVVQQLTAVDSMHAWINATGTGILRSADGGKTWIEINSQVKNSFSMHFFDRLNGILIKGEDSIIYQFGQWVPQGNDTIEICTTSDGGYNWIPVKASFASTEKLSCDIQYNGDTVYFATNKGRIFISYDRGYAWQSLNTELPDSMVISSLAMHNKNSFAFFAYPISLPDLQTLHFTNDGGTNWTQRNTEHSGFIVCMNGFINGYIINSCIGRGSQGGEGFTWLVSESGGYLGKLDNIPMDYAIPFGTNRLIGVINGWSIVPFFYVYSARFTKPK
jgi:photosystem II stability/assembly factor-like uncharacterized protein